jgi:hypothetical protein
MLNIMEKLRGGDQRRRKKVCTLKRYTFSAEKSSFLTEKVAFRAEKVTLAEITVLDWNV